MTFYRGTTESVLPYCILGVLYKLLSFRQKGSGLKDLRPPLVLFTTKIYSQKLVHESVPEIKVSHLDTSSLNLYLECF